MPRVYFKISIKSLPGCSLTKTLGGSDPPNKMGFLLEVITGKHSDYNISFSDSGQKYFNGYVSSLHLVGRL